MRYLTLTLLLIIGSLSSACPHAVAQIAGLKSRIPYDANIVVVINAEKLFGSAAAEQGRWEARRKAAFDAGLTFLAPDVSGVVLAAKMDLEFGKNVWELAQVRLNSPGNITSVAARFGGSIDKIDGRTAVRLPNDSIVVEVTNQIYASHTPANRQDVARWLRSTDMRAVDDTLTPYLLDAFAYTEKVGTPIIMAIDLEGSLSETQIKRRIDRGPLASLPADQRAAIVTALTTIRGATLGITVGDKAIGAIRVDFSSDISEVLKPVGRDMLIRALESQGAMIGDIDDWEVSFSKQTMLLQGPLSENGLRRVMSVLQLPPSVGQAMDLATETGGTSPESLQRIASQQYYKSVTSLLDDLKKEKRGANTVTAGGVAMWYDKYARKIDNLPLLNVDEALLAYGRDVSELLRGGENALRAVGMRSATRKGLNDGGTGQDTTYAYSEGYNGYGGYRTGYASGYVNPYYANREKGRTDAVIGQQERTRGAASAQQMWQTIETATADIRRDMTAKYQIEF